MPTLLHNVDGFDVIINTRDEHEPPHVHVWRAGNEAVINLGAQDTPPSIHEIKGNMSKKHVRKALSIIIEHQTSLIVQWDKYWEQTHGKVENK